MLGSLAVLRADPFTFTAFGEPWLNQQWGAGIVVRPRPRRWRAGAGSWSCARSWSARRRPRDPGGAPLARRPGPAALLALAGFVVGIASLGLRAQLFGIVLLRRRARDPGVAGGSAARWSGLLPLLVLAWANLHGSFFLGPAAVAIAAPGGPPRPARPRRGACSRCWSLSLVATVHHAVRPGGLGLRGRESRPTRRSPRLITEWQRTSPPDGHRARSSTPPWSGPLRSWSAQPAGTARRCRCSPSPGWPGWRSWAPTRSGASPGGRSGRPSPWPRSSPRSGRRRVAPRDDPRRLRRPERRRRRRARARDRRRCSRSGARATRSPALPASCATRRAASLARWSASAARRTASWSPSRGRPGSSGRRRAVRVMVDSRGWSCSPASAWADYADDPRWRADRAGNARPDRRHGRRRGSGHPVGARARAAQRRTSGWRLAYEDADGAVFVRQP